MTKLLVRWFVRDYRNVDDPVVRARYGKLGGIVGIVLNLLLFAAKFTGALIVGSVAVKADAFNNLSDAASSVIALVTAVISCKPADRDHPFGHARIEYVSSMIVSFLILLVGYNLVEESVSKIAAGGGTQYERGELILVCAILAASVLCKLFMFFFNRRLGTIIDSEVLRATAMDSLTDSAATSAVLAATVIMALTGADLDAWMGILVAGFILFAGIKVLNETKNSILGEAPTADTVQAIHDILRRFPEVLGIHDMVIHSYGPLRTMASFHVEVDGREDIFVTHDVIDNVEQTVKGELGIDCTIHMDPIVVGNEEVDRLKEATEDIIRSCDGRIRFHDFRCVIGQSHTNLIFDLDVPFEIKESDEALTARVQADITAKLGPQFRAVIKVDRS